MFLQPRHGPPSDKVEPKRNTSHTVLASLSTYLEIQEQLLNTKISVNLPRQLFLPSMLDQLGIFYHLRTNQGVTLIVQFHHDVLIFQCCLCFHVLMATIITSSANSAESMQIVKNISNEFRIRNVVLIFFF